MLSVALIGWRLPTGVYWSAWGKGLSGEGQVPAVADSAGVRGTGGGLAELVLIRHAESEGNVAAAAARMAGAEVVAVQTRDADVALSPLGVTQAQALGMPLGRLLNDPLLTVVWSSPYRRSLETAQIAVSVAGQLVPVLVDERLRDRELGVLDRLTALGVAARYPDEAAQRKRLGKFYHRPPGGESWADVALRLRSFLSDLERQAAERAVVFSHDAPIMLIRYICEQLTEQQLLQTGRADPLGNASMTTLRKSGGQWQLAAYNDVSHLAQTGTPITQHPGEPDADQ